MFAFVEIITIMYWIVILELFLVGIPTLLAICISIKAHFEVSSDCEMIQVRGIIHESD